MFRQILLALLLVFCALSGTAQAQAPLRILILHSYHSGMSWVDNLEEGIRDGLLRPPYDDAIVHTEYMDTKRNTGQEFHDRLVRIYKEKYRDKNLDLILACDNNAFDFILQYRDELFHSAPVVFGGVNDFQDESIEGFKDITGIAETFSFGETVETIRNQFPDTKEIFVVNDYLKTGRAWHNTILRDQKPYEDRLRFTHNRNLSTKELQDRIQSLQPGTVVLIGVYFADRDGEYLTYEKVGQLLTKDCPVPVYCLVRFNLRANVIGGKLLTGYHHGRMMSELGLLVLGGEKPGDIPVVKAGSNTFIFNWQGMQKFGISREQLPPDSVIINEPVSFYREHRLLVWAGVVAIILLSVLVLILARTVFKLQSTRKKLENSERNYKSIYDNASEGLFQTTLDGTILSANNALAHMFGYDSPSEVIEVVRNITEFYEDAKDREAMLTLLEQQGRVLLHTIRMKQKGGRMLSITVNARRARIQDGTEIVEGSCMDITERTKAEQDLIRMRSYLANIIDSMPSILVGVDQSGCVTLLNRRAEQCTNMQSGQAQGKPFTELFPWLQPYAEMIQESIAEQAPKLVSKVMRHEEAETRHENITVFPLSSDVDREAVIRIDDVSRNVQMERMMVQSEKMMSVGGLAAGMAHEINNPLAAIIGSVHNLRKRLTGDLPKNQAVAEQSGISVEGLQEYLTQRNIPTMLDTIAQSGDRAAGIVRNMLEFSRKSETSNAEYHDVATLLEHAVELAANVYDMQRQFDFRRIEIRREYEEGLPPVLCDGNEIQQVFLNLLKNGAEAMSEKEYGPVAPAITLRAYGKDNHVQIEIEDNGPGMPELVRRRVLEPFFTTKPVGQGTGLGLSVSYFIVTDLHKGRMDVQSVEGEWTRFVIALPMKEA